MDKMEVLNSLQTHHVINLMKKMGSESYLFHSEGLIFRTVCHHGDGRGSHKLYYYEETKSFYCYTCCGSMDIFAVLMNHFASMGKKLIFSNAKELVAREIEGGVWGFESEQAEIDFIDKYKSIEYTKPTLQTFDKTVLQAFSKRYWMKWVEEGISINTQKVFNIGFNLSDKRITIPHFNINGDLVGVRGRTIDPEVAELGFKYLPIKKGNIELYHPTSLNLYGIHLLKDTIRRTKRVVLVESEKSVMLGYEYLKMNSTILAVGGSFLSETQIQLLIELGVEEVTLAFDKEYHEIGDALYDIYVNKMNRLAKKMAGHFTVYITHDVDNNLDYKDSPIDKGVGIYYNIMSNRYLYS